MGDSGSDAYGVGISDRPGRVLPHAAATAKTLTLAAWIGVAFAGLLHTWPYRYRLVNLDSVSYLDVADAWRTLPWRDAVNGYWSPLYSWILAAAMAVVRPAPQHEYLLLHAVNVVLFLVAFAAWLGLVAQLRRACAADESTFSPRQIFVIAVLLFVWAGLTQLVVWMESPDLIVAACTFVACAMLLRLQRGGGTAAAAGLGAALGVGYLAKAAMFPLAIVYFAAAFLASRGARVRRTLVAVVVFAVLAGPWVAALTAVKGRFTTGDVGRLNYLWFVTRSEDWPKNWPVHWPHWDGVEGKGMPMNAARRLHADPAVYEFSTPFSVTYPMWYDASYWHAGVSPQLDLRDQVRRLRLSAADLWRLLTVNIYNRDLWNPQPVLLGVLAVVLFAGGRRLARERIPWVIVVPSAATIGMYAFVYIEPRYLGGAVIVLWMAVIAAVRTDGAAGGRRLLRAGTATIAAALAAAVVAALIYDGIDGWRRLLRGEPDETNQPWHIASVVRDMGIGPGSPVGVIGSGQVASRWARLGRVRITAEVPVADVWKFVALDRDGVRRVLDAFTRAGVVAVLAEQPPSPAARDGWTQLSGTPYWFYRLR